MIPADLPSPLKKVENGKIPVKVEKSVQNIELQDCLMTSDEVRHAPEMAFNSQQYP